MSDPLRKKGTGDLWAFNYCVSFIDLLGQRDAVRNQGLLPVFETDEQKRQFYSALKDSIGSIRELQTQAETMVPHLTERRRDSPIRAQLSPEEQATWDQMQLTRITTQRWSDGLVSFVCLGDQKVKCPVNGIYGLIGLAGTYALLGLVRKHLVRGAIEIAWGVELHPGELYGPAVARAYELESEVADSPRIVVGPQVFHFLRSHVENPEQDNFSRYNRSLAELCLRLLLQDADGFLTVHYLGKEFRMCITQRHHRKLYEMASRYVLEELDLYQRTGRSRLAFRYSHLAHYFRPHAP